jgi:galactose mutarotase-like enzyme
MPDSINHEGFTNTVLRVGEIYDRTTVYKFSVR